MEDVSDIRLREMETFLSLVSGYETDREISARAFHDLSEYLHGDFIQLSALLLETGSTASFAFLGRDVDRQARTIERLHRDGHEIVLHGHRHTRFDDLDYDTAYSDLSRGLTAIENGTGITPTGFFPPYKRASEGTVRAAADLGLEWILAETGAEPPADVAITEWVSPHDTVCLHRGDTPRETFEHLRSEAAPGTSFLFHPNVLEYYDAIDEFERWIREVEPVSVGERLAGGGVGVLFDCVLALRVA